MRIMAITAGAANETAESQALERPAATPDAYLWISCTREEFASRLANIQAILQAQCGVQLVDLHVSDLLNAQLPSRYDYTSQYDIVVFRRLATGAGHGATAPSGLPASHLPRRGGPPILRRIDTSPVGFAVFERVLLSVHPGDCAVRDAFTEKLLNVQRQPSRVGATQFPGSPADLMLRLVSQMVDGYLDLRRELSHQLDHWQTELLDPRARFSNWSSLLEARLSLHHLDEICEDQRSALQDWIESLAAWPAADSPTGQRERDLLQVRSRDVLEHIERVVRHVQRLEQSAETAVQMHFSAQGHRANEIMRTLTVLTAVFMPLNLIAGIFGMNFEFIPFLHQSNGFWVALGAMVLIAFALVLVFSRKRYLERSAR